MAEQNERNFQFRLRSSHRAPKYQTSNLVVEFLADSGLWEHQQLSITMPGFRLYLISLLLCQQLAPGESAQPSTDSIAFLEKRMKLCPISRNLPDSVIKNIHLSALA